MPGIVDQVLLEWGGGESLLLARVTDAEECWLCSHEVHRKLGSSGTLSCWHHFLRKGKQGASA